QSSAIKKPSAPTEAKHASSARPGFHPSPAAHSTANEISSGRIGRIVKAFMGTVLEYVSPAVIACDKREALAQGSEATKQPIDPRARKDGLLRGACHHC